MGNLGPLVLDISSDEETAFGGDKEDSDWLSKLLVEVGGNIDDDSDDVVFVSELFPKTLKRPDEDDDDCMILDGDPDNPVIPVNDKTDGDDDSDELEIVGEKGEVACRDFPHPRHLCAKYLFASTAHEVHCGQCHCYVCDSPAPCLHWGTGASSTEHCHASDKEEYWRAERKHAKKSNKPVTITTTTSMSIESFFQSIQVPGCSPSQPNSLPQNQGFKPVMVRPCVLSSNVGMPNAMNRERSQVPKYNPQSLLASVRSHPRSTNSVSPRVAPMNQSHHVGRQNPLSFHHPVFKRNGLVGPFTNNNHAHRSQLSRNPPLNRHPAFQGSNQHMYGSPAAGLPSRYNMDPRRANYLPSEAQINSRPIPSHRNRTFIPHQSQMFSQPSVSGSSLGLPPLQPYTCTEPSVGNVSEPYIAFAPDNHVPYQTVDSWQSDAGPDQLHSRSTISSSAKVVNDLENDSAQLQKQNSPTSMFTCGQNDVQHQYHTQSRIGSSPADFVLSCDSLVNHGNMLSHAAEISQVQSIQGDWPSVTPLGVDNPPQQNAEVDAINIADYQFPESREPDSSHFQFRDDWMFGNQSFTGAVKAAASPNVYSPETAFAETGMLFDFF
ncbi:hypothetical protein AAHA92_24082 [Salvia divinorum]|uniref:Uncharacterized protein n=1 Tax=Salvia divinorum TaxID=28513 RepID=A0ABD1G686_SALDI